MSIHCSYKIREPWRQERYCRAPGKWIVDYITPGDGSTMRTHAVAIRCTHHLDARFFPNGCSGFVTSSFVESVVEGCAPSAQTEETR